MPPKAERALRRVIADAARLHPDDLAALLETLDSDSRDKVERLLCEFEGNMDIVPVPEPPPPPASKPAIAFDASKLSGWLAGRLRDGEKESALMTPRAREVLRECAAALHPVQASTHGWFGAKRAPAQVRV